jgi:hypothetical protein
LSAEVKVEFAIPTFSEHQESEFEQMLSALENLRVADIPE